MKSKRSDSRLLRGRRLDVDLSQDPRNADFRMATVLPAEPGRLRSRRWECVARLDQGAEGACVGYAAAHWFACERMVQRVSRSVALFFYRGAQDHDQWPGRNYEGTSVTGLMRFLSGLGVIGEYRWIYDFDELVQTLALHGPVILGAQWREGCFEPDYYGVIRYTGAIRGGHAVTINEVDFESERIGIVQSWGRSHGINGCVWMSFDDARQMLLTRPSIAYPAKRALGQYEAPERKSFFSRLAFWR